MIYLFVSYNSGIFAKTKIKDNMLTKEQFCEVIDLIKKQREADDKFYDGMQMAFPDSYPPMLPNDNLWSALMKSLSYAMNDTAEFIEWWIYEDDMKGELTVTDNDVEYAFHNAEELYDYLAKIYN